MSVDKDTTLASEAEPPVPDPEAVHKANPPVLRPEGKPVSQNPVLIEFGTAKASASKYIICTFPEKRDDFRDLVKPIGFRWFAPHWQLPANGRVPDADVFCAALAHQLLSEGYMVQLKPYKAHQLALTETFDPLPTRWCERTVAGEFRDWFRFTWPYDDESSYSRCRALPGARYAEGAVYVPRGSAPAVLDFCERRNFALTAGARALTAEQETALENSLVLNIRRPSPKTPPGRPPAPKDISEDLRDV
jgi:hypothetical protein